jgi:hypothetical protein
VLNFSNLISFLFPSSLTAIRKSSTFEPLSLQMFLQFKTEWWAIGMQRGLRWWKVVVMDGATEMWAVSGEYLPRQAKCPGAAPEALSELAGRLYNAVQ